MKFLAVIILTIALSVSVQKAEAHPMGNFSINHYSGIVAGEKEIRIRYILDLAEIPAFQEIQEIDTDHDKTISPLEREAYLLQKVRSLASGLVLKVAEEEKPLTPISQEIEFPPGVGGLPTLKLTILYSAKVPFQKQVYDVFYRDNNYPGRAGWKEMSVAGDSGIALSGSTLPTSGGELRSYSEAGIKSPPQVLETRFAFAAGPSGGKWYEPSEAGYPIQTALRTQEVSLGGKTLASLMSGVLPHGPMVLFSFLIAFGLGTLHALSPGHGKTLVAAYLVGSRGTARHAFLLGVVVTLSHTVGVFLLGLATLYLSKFVVPERLYPSLGLLSGLAIAAIGFSLFRLRWQSLKHPPHFHSNDNTHANDNTDANDHAHHHDVHLPHDHSHSNHPTHAAHTGESGRSFRSLLGLGVSGGIIPCPSALVVLLSAIAFHQVGFGLLLIIAFSAGLAATLVGIGILMVYLGGMMNRFERYGSLSRIVPFVSSGAVAMLGGVIAFGSIL